MLPIKPLLEKKIKHSGLKSFVNARAMITQFQEVAREVLPEDIFKEITPVSFRNGVLKVRTSHPIISVELQAREDVILQKLSLKRILIEH